MAKRKTNNELKEFKPGQVFRFSVYEEDRGGFLPHVVVAVNDRKVTVARLVPIGHPDLVSDSSLSEEECTFLDRPHGLARHGTGIFDEAALYEEWNSDSTLFFDGIQADEGILATIAGWMMEAGLFATSPEALSDQSDEEAGEAMSERPTSQAIGFRIACLQEMLRIAAQVPPEKILGGRPASKPVIPLLMKVGLLELNTYDEESPYLHSLSPVGMDLICAVGYIMSIASDGLDVPVPPEGTYAFLGIAHEGVTMLPAKDIDLSDLFLAGLVASSPEDGAQLTTKGRAVARTLDGLLSIRVTDAAVARYCGAKSTGV